MYKYSLPIDELVNYPCIVVPEISVTKMACKLCVGYKGLSIAYELNGGNFLIDFSVYEE